MATVAAAAAAERGNDGVGWIYHYQAYLISGRRATTSIHHLLEYI